MSHQAPQSEMKLLIVDDDRSIRTLIARIASDWGYDTEETDSAESALGVLSKRKANIVLTDIKMGRMDGITFAEKIRDSMPSIAVIVMTGNPTPKTAKKSQDMGAIYYMQKPLDKSELGDTLKIAASWNIGMLTDRGARRFLSLRKGHERDQDNRLKAVKFSIKRMLTTPGWAGHLRDFVYDQRPENNLLFQELNKEFSVDSVKGY